jgi:hypothetical protein
VKGQIERTRLENDRQPTIESSYTTRLLHIAQPSQPTGVVYSTSEYLKEEEEEIESTLPTQKRGKEKKEKKLYVLLFRRSKSIALAPCLNVTCVLLLLLLLCWSELIDTQP